MSLSHAAASISGTAFLASVGLEVWVLSAQTSPISATQGGIVAGVMGFCWGLAKLWDVADKRRAKEREKADEQHRIERKEFIEFLKEARKENHEDRLANQVAIEKMTEVMQDSVLAQKDLADSVEKSYEANRDIIYQLASGAIDIKKARENDGQG